MKISDIKELIKNMNDDDEVVFLMYDKVEANDYIYNSFINGEEQPQITDDEWQFVISAMDKDDWMWQEIHESFAWAMNKIETNRSKLFTSTKNNIG